MVWKCLLHIPWIITLPDRGWIFVAQGQEIKQLSDSEAMKKKWLIWACWLKFCKLFLLQTLQQMKKCHFASFHLLTRQELQHHFQRHLKQLLRRNKRTWKCWPGLKHWVHVKRAEAKVIHRWINGNGIIVGREDPTGFSMNRWYKVYIVANVISNLYLTQMCESLLRQVPLESPLPEWQTTGKGTIRSAILFLPSSK